MVLLLPLPLLMQLPLLPLSTTVMTLPSHRDTILRAVGSTVIERLPSVVDQRPLPLPCWLLLAVVVRGGRPGGRGLCASAAATAHPDTSLQPQKMNFRGPQHYQTEYILYDADKLPMLVN